MLTHHPIYLVTTPADGTRRTIRAAVQRHGAPLQDDWDSWSGEGVNALHSATSADGVSLGWTGASLGPKFSVRVRDKRDWDCCDASFRMLRPR